MRPVVVFLPVCFRASQPKTSPQLVLIWLVILVALVFKRFITGTFREPRVFQDVGMWWPSSHPAPRSKSGHVRLLQVDAA